ncbi:pre-peptidase C-terminal domain-containing protein [Myxococcota bacterium]|nr:pre-peptidase C-terminal domain-containing protein [Myxococcota bacterium]MBU1537070.1 pre-peptidase C-terminal domain-containing protein [Myxococcota bacterium]
MKTTLFFQLLLISVLSLGVFAACDDDDDNNVSAVCGNGVIEGSEQCDDGNVDDGDGCSALCLTEVDTCGDDVVDAGEECDPPDGTTCDDNCMFIVSDECDEADTEDTDCADATTGQWCWDGGEGGALFCGCDPDYGNSDCGVDGYGYCNPATNKCEAPPACGDDSFEANEDEANAADLTAGTAIDGVTCEFDADWFQYTPVNDTAAIVTLTWTDDTATDLDVYVTDCAGNVLASGESGDLSMDGASVTGLTIGTPVCIYVSIYEGPATGMDIGYNLMVEEATECFLDDACDTGEVCPASGICTTEVPANAGCGDDVAGDNDRPSLAETLTSDATVTEGSCDGNPSNPVDLDWYTFSLAEGDNMVLTVNQLTSLTGGDVDVLLYDAEGTLWATAGTVNNPEVISAAGLPAGDYYVLVYYYDNDGAAASSATYEILLSVTSGSGCADRDDCAALYARGECDTGLCVEFDGAAAQTAGEFCDNDADCDPDTTGSEFFNGLCFTADNTDGDDNMCIMDCDTEADCTAVGMHCTLLSGGTAAGICLPPCTSDAGCAGLTCNTDTNACEE